MWIVNEQTINSLWQTQAKVVQLVTNHSHKQNEILGDHIPVDNSPISLLNKPNFLLFWIHKYL